ncbi:unnamed protein product [Larinioides sclopetarius]|uniref:Bromo domain-containing protein n=1 Tax=Larinioides sclopetarius TaxID=280406 RepID=A0AAV2ATF8_9ARAC
MLVKNLTERRLNELEWLNQQTKAAAETLRMQIENVENGDFDENLDELIKELEDQERREEEQYNEYVLRRESLNKAKKLNRSRIARGKSTANISVLKKKTSVNQDIIEEFAQHLTAEDINKNVKIEINKDMPPAVQSVVIKTEENDVANAQLNSVVSVPSSFPQSSPLLTSLLSSIASPSSSQISSSINTPVKKPNPVNDSDDNKEEIDTMDLSQECSPRHLDPKSPPSTSDSSPLLNSLLKNSQSASINLFTSPGKEISPNTTTPSRPFFNPTSSLATAAAQQLVAATSATFNDQNSQQLELPEKYKTNLQFFKTASACSAAPTLSKLLEMPPSTPGKLPPLPIVDSPVSSTLPISIQMAKNSKQSIPEFCSEAASKIEYLQKESSFSCNTSMLQKSMTSYSLADKKNIMFNNPVSLKETLGSEKSLNKKRKDIDDASQESIDILEAVCESINQAFEEKERQKNLSENKKLETNGTKVLVKQAADISKIQDMEANKFCIEELSSAIGDNPLSLFEEDLNHTFTSSDRKYSEESIDSFSSTSFEFTLNKNEEVPSEEGKKANEKKFYRSRAFNKKEDSTEKNKESSSLLESPNESIYAKSESEISETSFTSNVSSVVGSTEKKQQDSNSSSPMDPKSPIFKNARTSIENMEMIQVEVPMAPRTYSRRGKRRRGRPAKSIPIKQAEPEDQYEFTESTEENSVVYRTSNTLCYMPRMKEDFQQEDSKEKAFSPMESEGMTSNSTSPSSCRKNAKLSSLNEEPSNFQSLNATGALFGSNERMSDSLTSDEASNHFLNEDKFKKWEENCEENDDGVSRSSIDNSNSLLKVVEISKKKCSTPVRSSPRILPVSKGKKQSSSVFLEELSTRSRDLEEMFAQNPVDTKEKNFVPVESLSLGIKSNDCHVSSLSAIESNKQIDDVEECESLQGSITTVVSPPSANVIEGQEFLYDKQDLFNIVSPKCSETILQRSEEYESDNWDSQSASTNKSSSYSSETRPRLRRKESDTAEYKAWKKAISIVLREASCHKNANIFLQKVTNDVAPGYLNIVHRPMDLSLIKKNIDTGVIRTTDEFHRDMLLMFQNAIMYNSSDHDVYQMAVEMQRDVLKQISAFLATQSRNKEEISEASSLRGARTVKSHKKSGKQSTAANSSNQKDETD